MKRLALAAIILFGCAPQPLPGVTVSEHYLASASAAGTARQAAMMRCALDAWLSTQPEADRRLMATPMDGTRQIPLVDLDRVWAGFVAALREPAPVIVERCGGA